VPDPVRSDPPERCDLAVVGAGIVGLAVARELALRHPRLHVCVLEAEDRPAAHQTSHNSGVLHAGIYYAPGTLKAQLCVEGGRELMAYCIERGLPHRSCGKLIVAATVAELGRLDELERRGRANGVTGLKRLGADGLRGVEPHARGLAALHCSQTAIVDFEAVARSFAQDLRAAGGSLATGCAVQRLDASPGGLRVIHRNGVLEAGHAVVCAGAWADRIAVASGASPDPRIVPFRGSYLRLVPERSQLVRALVYPVPDPALPFLGVHLTRTLSGDVLIGPTALLAGARDAYGLTRIRAADVAATLAWPGTWRLFRRWWRTGIVELRHAASRTALMRDAARLVPGLGADDAEPAFAGVRAQALGRDGRLLQDFAFSATPRALHVRNAPSPAATSSLAIARIVADRIQREFAVGDARK
jgi:(S)-2-hydroxyglutarate dehydrogenase